MDEAKRKSKTEKKNAARYDACPAFHSSILSIPLSYKALIMETTSKECVVVVAAFSQACANECAAAVVQALNNGLPTRKPAKKKKTIEQVITDLHRIGDQSVPPVLFVSGQTD